MMTGPQFDAAIRKRLGYSQRGFAREVLGDVRQERKVRRWVAEGPPEFLAIIVRLMLVGKVTAADIEKARSK